MKKLFAMFSVFALVLVFASSASAATNYNPRVNPPTINPADFTMEIDNPYFSLPIGKKLVYKAETKDGLEKIVIMVPGWTKTVQGVETLVFWDRVYLNGELIEDTRDYLAQHKQTGDLWYFGEHVDNYENGKLVDHDGAWFAGVDGAIAGIWVPANPQVGDYFMNELLLGEAEDESEIVGVNETVTTPLGAFTQCVKSLDGSPLFEAKAYTYHCKDAHVKNTVFEEEFPNWPDKSEVEHVKLVEVDLNGAHGITLPSAYTKEGVVSGLSADSKGRDGSGNNEERGDNNKNEREWFGGIDDDDGQKNEDKDCGVIAIVSIIGLLLIGAAFLLKFVFNKFELKRRPKNDNK